MFDGIMADEEKCCPITLEPLTSSLVAVTATGKMYKLDALQEWFNKCPLDDVRDPATNAPVYYALWITYATLAEAEERAADFRRGSFYYHYATLPGVGDKTLQLVLELLKTNPRVRGNTVVDVTRHVRDFKRWFETADNACRWLHDVNRTLPTVALLCSVLTCEDTGGVQDWLTHGVLFRGVPSYLGAVLRASMVASSRIWTVAHVPFFLRLLHPPEEVFNPAVVISTEARTAVHEVMKSAFKAAVVYADDYAVREGLAGLLTVNEVFGLTTRGFFEEWASVLLLPEHGSPSARMHVGRSLSGCSDRGGWTSADALSVIRAVAKCDAEQWSEHKPLFEQMFQLDVQDLGRACQRVYAKARTTNDQILALELWLSLTPEPGPVFEAALESQGGVPTVAFVRVLLSCARAAEVGSRFAPVLAAYCRQSDADPQVAAAIQCAGGQ